MHNIFDSNKKQVHVLLVIYPDTVSKLFRFLSRNIYSHASIGMSGPDGQFYSLGVKGFRIEEPQKHPTFKGHEVPCVLYSIDVTDETYAEFAQVIAHHVENGHHYKYDYIGLVLALLRSSLKRKNRYFCSQFVADVLNHSGTLKTKKAAALCFPDDFRFMEKLKLRYTGTLKELLALRALPG